MTPTLDLDAFVDVNVNAVVPRRGGAFGGWLVSGQLYTLPSQFTECLCMKC